MAKILLIRAYPKIHLWRGKSHALKHRMPFTRAFFGNLGYALIGIVFLLAACTADSGRSEQTTIEGLEPSLEPNPEQENCKESEDIALEGLVWSDEFNGDSLDARAWICQIGTGEDNGLVQWGNEELQYYRKENVSVKDGCLSIKAKREDFEKMTYTSSRLYTTASFKYGKIVAKIKLPAVEGMWPAFWLLPRNSPYGNWPASGEIDIMENRGRVPGKTSGAAHYARELNTAEYFSDTYEFPSGTDATEFHEYSLEWTPVSLKWMVDGNLYMQMDHWGTVTEDGAIPQPAPYDQEFYILLNMAVGGHFDGYTEPDDDFTEAEMLVDYVRVFNLETAD
jgi:beta-glucanase (GH16 family)